MPQPLEIQLTSEQRAELEQIRDHAPKAYQRERAAAILKIAGGQSALQVAEYGLLKRRKYQTVCDWVARYRQHGRAGLGVKPGRGRKPAFSPSTRDAC
jgi:transposase